MKNNSTFEVVMVGIGTMVFILLVAGLFFALPVMLLWNWLITSIFNLRRIGFLEAYGLYILCNMLFRQTQNNDSNKQNTANLFLF